MSNLATEIDRLKSTLADNPRSVLFARLADYLLQTDQMEEAIRVCGYGLDHNPHYANGHFVLGKCHFQSGDLDSAESEFNKALLYDPNHINAHHFQAKIMKQRDWRNAYVLWIKRALAIDPLDQTTRMLMSELEEDRGAETDEIEDDFTVGVLADESQDESASDDQLKEVEMAFSQEGGGTVETSEADVEEEVVVEEDDLSLDDITGSEDTDEEDEIEEPVDESEQDAFAADDEEKRYEFILDDIFKEEGSSSDTLTEDEEGGDADEGVIEEPYEEEETEPPQPVADENVEKAIESETVSQEQVELEEPVSAAQPEVSAEEKEKIADEVFGDEDEDVILEDDFDEEVIEEPDGEEEQEEDEEIELTDLESEQDIIEDVMGAEESEVVEEESEEKDDQMIDFAPAEESDVGELLEEELLTEDELQITEEEPQEDEPPKEEEEKTKSTPGKKEPIVTATLGEIYAAQGHYSKAIGVYEILLKKDPQNQHYKTKIEALQKKQEEQDRED